MTAINLALLVLSIVLSAGRNLLSKSISGVSFGEKNFFLFQTCIFYSGAVLLLMFSKGALLDIAPLTLVYALIYGIMLLLAQWCYTAALKFGNTSICATVYSLGFIFPTMSGMLFWAEEVSAFKMLGILLVIPTIILSGSSKKQGTGDKGNYGYFLPLLIAMLSSGGLGIMQKVQQNSPYQEQKTAFVLVAFLIAGTVSLFSGIFRQKGTEKIRISKIACACGVGICFGSCNLLNTILAGRLSSAVFFPTLNIGNILLSLVLSILLFKEKITGKQPLILALAIISILLINLQF